VSGLLFNKQKDLFCTGSVTRKDIVEHMGHTLSIRVVPFVANINGDFIGLIRRI